MRVASRTGPRPGGKVREVAADSLAAMAGVEPGDEIVAINGVSVTDVLDFRFEESAEECALDFRKPDGTLVAVSLEKDPEDVLGIEFADDLFDGIRTCKNNCPFCFVYQNPRRMRRTVYIKDEDYRYSFLHGNYMTLSNLSEEDWGKIFRMRLSPLYVSIHATEPALRTRLLGTKEPRPILEMLQRLVGGGIEFYGQIVSIPGWNDGPELDRTLTDLLPLYPQFRGLAIVPVGLTTHRAKLVELPSYVRESALAMIEHGERIGRQMKRKYGRRIAYLADEFYLAAGLPVPPMSYYDGYVLREDGVGMIRKFTVDFRRAFPRYARRRLQKPPVRTVIATGRAARPMFAEVVEPALRQRPDLDVRIVDVENLFYGNTITVAGLLSATDYLAAFRGKLDADKLIIPAHSLRSDGACFLDDVTPEALSAELGAELVPIPDSAEELLRELWGYPRKQVFDSQTSTAEVAIYGS
ncbi:MAG: DUF512 domain-containing protein [Candidatus Wallbacteria bacterium]|nr:DUF512 domain-containing protein [Candidatus Wallbacteria bacterium]